MAWASGREQFGGIQTVGDRALDTRSLNLKTCCMVAMAARVPAYALFRGNLAARARSQIEPGSIGSQLFCDWFPNRSLERIVRPP
ncbi:hypothetical protein [Rubidibacter lacunae]|uniref:hypothetical protein n=1 Tax=Rubidibacter lacunae TaxID=582514 RepID=UPI000426DB81|nr:hypothetical protein [Rubidibacter lacunae]